jgi:hypothetical protein
LGQFRGCGDREMMHGWNGFRVLLLFLLLAVINIHCVLHISLNTVFSTEMRSHTGFLSRTAYLREDRASCKSSSFAKREMQTDTYNRRDSQMVTYSSTSRPVQCLCMAERTGCLLLTCLRNLESRFQPTTNEGENGGYRTGC